MKRLILSAGCCVALLLAAPTAPAAPPAEFCVNDFGATADGPATNTAAIQRAIDAAAAAGAGVVTFSNGTYLSGAIFLKSNVRLRLQILGHERRGRDVERLPGAPSAVGGGL